MTSIRLRYVQAFADRHGRARYYFRRPGVKRVALPGAPGSAEFMQAYQAALAGAPKAVVGKGRAKPGTFNALIVAYYRSAEYKTLAEITRKTYRGDMERFRREHGDASVAGIQTKHIRVILDEMADRPGAAYSRRRIIRILMRFAQERGWRNDNPATGVKKVRSKATGGHKTWAEEDIAQFEKHWKPGTRARLALALLLYTAQRRSDVVTLGRQHVKDGRINVVQAKSGGRTKLWIPLHPRLAEALKTAPADQLCFLMTQEGKPFSPAGFTNWFVESAKAAGLSEGLTPHGLRKAAARRLAEAGCTGHQIMAITGHKNLSEVTLYTAAANQERLADSAMEAQIKSENGTPDVKPASEV